MPAQLNDRIVIDAPSLAVPEILVTSLTSCGWQITFNNATLGRLVATDDDEKVVYGMAWRYKFRLNVSWQPNSSPVTVNLQIVETKSTGGALMLCKERLDLIKGAILSDGLTFVQNGSVKADPAIYPSASWVSGGEIDANDMYLHNGETESVLIGFDGNGTVKLTPTQAEMHVLVCGPTRSGKTTGVFIPNLIERTGSPAIVTEATSGSESPDLYSKTARWRQSKGHDIFYFNPDDLTSHGVNPLDQIDISGDAPISQVNRLVDILMRTTTHDKHAGDQFWELGERVLLKALILHALSQRENGRAHLGYISELLFLPEPVLRDVFAGCPIQEARDCGLRFFEKGSDVTRAIMLEGLYQRLDLWSDPRIVALTKTTEIDLKGLPDKLFTFYIAMPGHKPNLQPLASLIFNWIMDTLLTCDFRHPPTCYFDEFTNFGYVQRMDNKLTTIGHRRIPIIFGIQDYSQLTRTYKDEAHVFKSQPGTRIFFRPRDLDVAKAISDALGTTTLIDTETTSTGQIVRNKIQRSLMSADELMSLQRGEIIVFLPTTRPAKLNHFLPQHYSDCTKEAPSQRPAKKVDRGLKFRPQKVSAVNSEPTDDEEHEFNESVQELHGRMKEIFTEISDRANRNEVDGLDEWLEDAKEAQALMAQADGLSEPPQGLRSPNSTPNGPEPKAQPTQGRKRRRRKRNRRGRTNKPSANRDRHPNTENRAAREDRYRPDHDRGR